MPNKESVKLEGLTLFGEMLRSGVPVSSEGFFADGGAKATHKPHGLIPIGKMIYYKEDVFSRQHLDYTKKTVEKKL